MTRIKIPNIEFHSLLEGIKDVKTKNETFESLSKQGQRLEIAWEVLQLIEQTDIKAAGHKTSYWNAKILNLWWKKNLKKQKINEYCKVCARGAITLAKVMLCGEYEPGNAYGLTDVFGRVKLLSLENAFENCDFPYPANTIESIQNIMCNILVNGDWKPSDTTDYLIDRP